MSRGLTEYNIFRITLAVVLKMEARKAVRREKLHIKYQWLIFKAPNLVQNIHKKRNTVWQDSLVGWSILLYTKRLQVQFLVTANSQVAVQSLVGAWM